MDEQVQEFVDSPDWLFQEIHGESMQYLFAHVSSSTYRDSSFLDHRMKPAPTVVKGAPVGAVNANLKNDGRAANYIFHSAFCCSTLLSNCLQFVSDSLVLKEPKALGVLADALAQSRLSGGFNPHHWRAILAPSLRLLEKTYADQQGAIIKPSNSANNLIQDVLGLRPSNSLFMYGSLRDFLLSNLKGLEESRAMVPLFLKRLFPLTDYADRLPAVDFRGLDHMQQCAVLWHAQIYHFSRLAAANSSVRCLATDDFLQEPENVAKRALDYFGLPCDTARLDQLAEIGPLSQHSKSGLGYDSTSRANENAALAAQHENVLNTTLDWMDGLLSTLPVNLPLQPQL